MGSTSNCRRDIIGILIGVTASEDVQDTLDSVSSANDILVEKSHGEVGGLAVSCSCWDTLLGIRIT